MRRPGQRLGLTTELDDPGGRYHGLGDSVFSAGKDSLSGGSAKRERLTETNFRAQKNLP